MPRNVQFPQLLELQSETELKLDLSDFKLFYDFFKLKFSSSSLGMVVRMSCEALPSCRRSCRLLGQKGNSAMIDNKQVTVKTDQGQTLAL